MTINQSERQLTEDTEAVPLPTLIEQLRDIDTALIANSIGGLTQEPEENWYMSSEIQSVTPTLGPTVGVAMTCEMDTSSPGGEPGNLDGYWEQLEQMHQANEPIVWVVKAVGSRPKHECILGDGMAKMLYAAGCIGVVTDGGVRDVAGLVSTSFAAYSCGTTIHHCPLRVRRIGTPVSIGGITISSGDLIHANQEGVIRIPSDCYPSILESAHRNAAFERKAHGMLRRTDLSSAQKRERLAALLQAHSVSDCVSDK